MINANYKYVKFAGAFTLVELMTALAISLILLLGVIELFRSVGGTIQETQATLNMSANLNNTAIQLRSDLGKVEPNLAHQPHNMVKYPSTYSEENGYIEIIEGMNAPYSDINNYNGGKHILTEQIALNSDTGQPDLMVGDVDDILAFTAAASSADYPFRGLVNGTMQESIDAEIIYFVRGNTLYRRVLLILGNPTGTPPNDYANNDVSVSHDAATGNLQFNTLETLKDRRFRFAHCPKPISPAISAAVFPFPIYSGSAAYYLRLPTLEETVHTNWASGGYVGYGLPAVSPVPTLNYTAPAPFLDLWDTTKCFPIDSAGTAFPLNAQTGSLTNFTTIPHAARAGEDIVLKNVLSFDVKVWNPYWVPLIYNGETSFRQSDQEVFSSGGQIWAPPQYVDLGQDKFYSNEEDPANSKKYKVYEVNYTSPPVFTDNQGFGFTTKGHYGGVAAAGAGKFVKSVDYTAPDIKTDFSVGQPMPCVFDSWTKSYEKDPAAVRGIDNSSGGISTTVSNYGGTPTPRQGTGISNPENSGNPSTNANEWECPPPYEEDLTSIQITIRCFDPDSKTIRQVRVVHHFP